MLACSGCSRAEPPPLVVVTTWPAPARARVEATCRSAARDPGPILWVLASPGESLSRFLDRRGGVDVLLGGPVAAYARLAESGRLARPGPGDLPWGLVRLPAESPEPPPAGEVRDLADPRDDPSSLASARRKLESEGWAKEYDELVRLASRSRPAPAGPRPTGPPAEEGMAIPIAARDPSRARRFVESIRAGGLAKAAPAGSEGPAAAEGLLADWLGAALIDAREELRDADAALRRFGHPPAAEGAIGERPPWPPASVARLLAAPNGPALVDTLAEQVAPDPESRAWLRASWSGPRRSVDGGLLAEIAGAAGGKLAREPRFRAWLRAEWTAWSRQLYRRVARVAGGYVPS